MQQQHAPRIPFFVPPTTCQNDERFPHSNNGMDTDMLLGALRMVRRRLGLEHA